MSDVGRISQQMDGLRTKLFELYAAIDRAKAEGRTDVHDYDVAWELLKIAADVPAGATQEQRIDALRQAIIRERTRIELRG